MIDDEKFPFIPEEHKDLVRERIKMAKEHPEMLLDWDDAIKTLLSNTTFDNNNEAS